jgi:hypothetical protein
MPRAESDAQMAGNVAPVLRMIQDMAKCKLALECL